MTRTSAFTGSALFFLLAPGSVAGLAPWLITRWRLPAIDPDNSWRLAATYALGPPLIVYGLAILIEAFVRFAAQGLGTPAPVAPPERLVIRGPYARVRNPMYVAVLALIVGQALLFGHPLLWLYALVAFAAFHTFVTHREEPALRLRFGADYERYVRHVPRWIPRAKPWSAETDESR